MSDWQPAEYHEDPMVNAVLNLAASTAKQAEAINGLLYGLKYSKQGGTSIAEAIENVGAAIKEHALLVGGAVEQLSDAVKESAP